MKRVKYTNTEVTPLTIIKKGRTASIHCDMDPDSYMILTTIRNESKYGTAQTQIEYMNHKYQLEMNKDTLISYIQNSFLLASLVEVGKYELVTKLFSESDIIKDTRLNEFIILIAKRRYKRAETI